MIDHRPSNGGGSCARCRNALGLASEKVRGDWYCSSACAAGRPTGAAREAAVPETWLYARPRRFFRARRAKELR